LSFRKRTSTQNKFSLAKVWYGRKSCCEEVFIIFKIICFSQKPVSHTCNPSYSAEIRRIEVPSQLQQNRSRDPILKKPITKQGWWSS
jgi:hypothetical protein